MVLTVLTARQSDVDFLAPRLRLADRAELLAAGSAGPREALQEGFDVSEPCLVAVADGDPIALFGVAPVDGLEGGYGSPWLLGTPGIEDHYRAFARASRDWLVRLQVLYPVMSNLVDSRNLVHVRWLDWLGARWGGKVLHNGVVFRQFWFTQP